jgi:hypothetical protein
MMMNPLLSTHMGAEADIVLETRAKRLLVVECTWMKEPSVAAATETRDGLAQLWSIDFEYFMLAFHTELHLWRKDAPSGSQPMFTASASQIWRDYLGSLVDSPRRLRSPAMAIAVSAWLNDLANNVSKPDPDSDADRLLLRSGLYDQMRGGVVRRHVPA